MPIASFIRPTPANFLEQIEIVNNYAALRVDRGAEVLAQMGISEAFFGSITGFQPDRTPKSWELALTVLRTAYYLVMRVKHALACRRPHEYSPQLQPMIAAPMHGTLPSGHATEAFTCAYVMWRLLKAAGRPPIWGEQLMRLANRIAVNRTVAGVHFPVDSAAGCMLGLTLGEYIVARCTNSSEYTAWRFDGTRFKGDFLWRALLDIEKGRKPATADGAAGPFVESAGPQSLDPAGRSPILEWIWNEAVKEWKDTP
ncbi:MAG: phosphatase PAP2 family protein [Hyphomicrobiaceae bacterium]|nr:phosphatase PAP2 family protein [Hyphomicrobiaceae bacterium]